MGEMPVRLEFDHSPVASSVRSGVSASYRLAVTYCHIQYN